MLEQNAVTLSFTKVEKQSKSRMVETNTNESNARIIVLKSVELNHGVAAFNLPISSSNLNCISKRKMLVVFGNFVLLLVIRISESQVTTQHEDLILSSLDFIR